MNSTYDSSMLIHGSKFVIRSSLCTKFILFHPTANTYLMDVDTFFQPLFIPAPSF